MGGEIIRFDATHFVAAGVKAFHPERPQNRASQQP
jgi:hypothetical protein